MRWLICTFLLTGQFFCLHHTALAQSVSNFPNEWLGEWEGELAIYKGSQKLQTIPMRMIIEANGDDGNLRWSTIYNSKEGELAKPYTLQVLDAEKGLYLMDENNSIKIESYLFDNRKLVSWYAVQQSLILATHEMQDGQLLFSILAGSMMPASVTGGEEVDGEEIPEVTTYPVTIMQQAVLNRKK